MTSKEQTHRDFSIDRRRLLGTTAGAAGAAFAFGGLPGLAGRAVVAQDGAREFHAAWPYQIPPTGHFNLIPNVTNGIFLPPNIYADLIIEPFAMYYWATDEWLPLMATEWGFQDGDIFQIKLRQGAMWSDGNEFTADDVLATFWSARITSNTIWKYIDEIEAPDQYTVNFHMSQPSTVVERYVLRFNTMSAATYGEWGERAREFFGDGGTVATPEGAQLLDEFINYRPDDVIASGPFMFDVDSITNAQLTLVKNDSAWNADQVLFDRIVDFNGETPDITPIVLAKDVDYATQGFPPATEQEMLASDIRVLRPPIYSGPAIYINYNRFGNVFGDPRVRQAMAMAINRVQNGIIALGDSGIGVQYMAGMSDNLVPTWIDDVDIASLNTYPYEPDTAAEMLEELGWTKDGDVWVTPDGTRAEFELSFPAEFADWSAAGQDVADQLTAFGFQITPRAVTFTQHPVDVNRGDFDLAIRAWGASTNPHPHFSYVQAFFTHNTLAVNDGGQGMGYDLTQDTSVTGTVDLEQLTLDAADGLDEEAQKEDVTAIALAFNELLPIIPLFERYGNNAALEGVRVAEWPADDDPIMLNSPYADGIPTMLMLTGKLQPAEG
ncbi:MAG: ABC transporter substrate-binding protein [Thermomicrobiales bacterium]